MGIKTKKVNKSSSVFDLDSESSSEVSVVKNGINLRTLQEFELPRRLELDKESYTSTFGRFTADPLEKGYGHTIGNALRRVLLSSIEGAAIAYVLIDGVKHEFQCCEGIKEDVAEIVLNLKKVHLITESNEPITLEIDVNKVGLVVAGDIKKKDGVTIVNPDQVICTLTEKRPFHAEMEVITGRGYILADANKKEGKKLGTIAIDSLFSPVVFVKYIVENTRVGKMTDYDKLILEITTDGRVTPEYALKEACAILQHHFALFDSFSKAEFEFEDKKRESVEEENQLRKLLNMSVSYLDLSVRSSNCLNKSGIMYIGELASMTEDEMLKHRNFGKKSLNEIKEHLGRCGLSLNMKIDKRLLDNLAIK